MADTSVKLIHSGMAGAPTLANVAGNLVAVLNAALVDGFGSNTVDSLVIAGGVATVTRGAGHPFDVGAVALISGATTTTGTVNGEQRVLSVTSTSYTFDATGIGNQTATGTISHKVAPLGWGRPFAGSSTLQVYRSADLAGTRMYLRVDDAGTTNGRVVGYEAMTTDSAGTGPFPTTAQVSGGLYWPKSNNSTPRTWMVVGDSRLFYLWVTPAGSASFISAFGDFQSRKSPDPYSCMCTGATADRSAMTSSDSESWGYSTFGNQVGCYMPRETSGLGAAVGFGRAPSFPRAINGQSGSVTTELLAFPNPSDSSLYLAPFTIQESISARCYRGDAPGVFFVPHSIGPGVFAVRERITGVTGYAGRAFAAFPHASGVTFFDTTGPWR